MTESEISAALRPYLLPGERLVWTGQPMTGLRFTAYDVFLIPFSLVWTGIVALASGASLVGSMRGETMFPLSVVPFFMLAVGLYFVAGRFFVDAWVRGRTAYGLTDRRAVVLRRAFGDKLMAQRLNGEVRISRQRGARGTLSFGPVVSPFRMNGMGLWMPGMSGEVAFEGIEDVMRVYALAGKSVDA